MTKIAFTLSMPNRGSWDGKWSGEENSYCVVRQFSESKKGQAIVQKLLDNSSYYYRWSDGWGASVDVKQVDGKESAALRRKSKGFCGYDWMINSIITHGAIYASHDEIPKEETK